jgi:hypothetical protein
LRGLKRLRGLRGWDFRLPMLVFSPIIKESRFGRFSNFKMFTGAGFQTGVFLSIRFLTDI